MKPPHPPTGTAAVKARIQLVNQQADRPSWFDKPPHRFTEIGVGSIKASEYRNLYRLEVPFALISLWGIGTRHADRSQEAFYRRALDSTMGLVQAMLLLGLFNQSEHRRESYRSHLRDWRMGTDADFPEVRPKPSWHYAFHIYDFIPLFGPLPSWWLFPFEQLIGHLQRLPHNHKYDCKLGHGESCLYILICAQQ